MIPRVFVFTAQHPARPLRYRGGLLGAVADRLERFYADGPALADTDADGIFTVPELVTLLRASRDAAFHAWADPSQRRN